MGVFGPLESVRIEHEKCEAFVAFVDAQAAAMLQPNPARNVVSVQGGGDRLEVLDAQGRLRLEQALPGGGVQLDVSDWPAGMYIVRLLGPGGIQTERLIVE